ncbi:MAG TPA: hypothetical protein VIW26_12050 [Gemmatimonadales bacterium]|jgi:hypothetical protein
MVAKLNESESSYFKEGEIEKALVAHDAAKELLVHGTLTMSTLQAARELGILGRIESA